MLIAILHASNWSDVMTMKAAPVIINGADLHDLLFFGMRIL